MSPFDIHNIMFKRFFKLKINFLEKTIFIQKSFENVKKNCTSV